MYLREKKNIPQKYRNFEVINNTHLYRMKTLIFFLSTAFILLGCGSNNSTETTTVDDKVVVTDSTDIVYGTPKSDKYHNSKDCYALKNASDIIELYREQAVVTRKACKNCVDSTKKLSTSIVNKLYTISGSNIYHAKPSCFHLKNSHKVQVCEEDSVKATKKPCKDCWKK